MKKLSATARTLAGTSLVALAAAGSAHAAALEQTCPTTIRLLYQEGRYIEFGVAYTDPDQSGEGATIPAGVLGADRRCRSPATPATSSRIAGTSAARTRPTSTTGCPTR